MANEIVLRLLWQFGESGRSPLQVAREVGFKRQFRSLSNNLFVDFQLLGTRNTNQAVQAFKGLSVFMKPNDAVNKLSIIVLQTRYGSKGLGGLFRGNSPNDLVAVSVKVLQGGF